MQRHATERRRSGHRRVLDLGGGTGSFLKAILPRYPDLQCTLFELPTAAAVARQKLASDPLGRKIKIVEGDFLKEPCQKGTMWSYWRMWYTCLCRNGTGSS